MYRDYIKNFNIIETYKDTNLQKIFIASSRDHAGSPVLINVFLDKTTVETLYHRHLHEVFDNLIDIQKGQDYILLVTKFHRNTIPLEIYLDSNTLKITEKIELISHFLQKTIQYDVLPNYFKDSLIDFSQVSIKDNTMFFDEIIILNESSLDDNDFSPVAKEISRFINRLIPENTMEEENQKTLNKILNFAKDLITFPYKYKNFQEVLDSYNNIFIDNSGNQAGVLAVGINNLNKNIIKKKNSYNYKTPLVILSIMALLATGYLLYKHIGGIGYRHDLQASKEMVKPIAYFEKKQEDTVWKFINKSFMDGNDGNIEESFWQVSREDEIIQEISSEDLSLKFQEDGVYTISLKVRDSFKNWSEEYIETIQISTNANKDLNISSTNTSEKTLAINPLNEESVSKDTDIFKKEGFSYRFEKNADDSLPGMRITDLNKRENLNLSMWMRSSNLNPFTIYLNGYNDNSKVIYKKSINHHPKTTDSWELINVDFKTNKVHKLEVLLSNDIEKVWLSDIEITSYK